MRLRLREPLLYAWLRLQRTLDRRARPASELGTTAIRRILAISCTALGDTLMTTPALRALRAAYPQAHITLLVHPALLALFTGLPEVDQLLPYDGKWRHFLPTARQLKGYDLAAIFHGNEPQATPLAYLSGARHIFKLPNNSRWNFLLSNRQPILSWDELGHGIDQRLAVARLAGARDAGETEATDSAKSLAARRMSVPLHAAGQAALDQSLAQLGWQAAPLLALQPGASTMSRRWPRSRFIAAALALARRYPALRFVVTGSPAEAALCQEVAAGINAGLDGASNADLDADLDTALNTHLNSDLNTALNAGLNAALDTGIPPEPTAPSAPRAWASAGVLPLLALPALLQRCCLLVSGDTGPMHLAVALETPVVALFAVSDPARSGPPSTSGQHLVIRKWRTCNPCASKNCPYAEPLCMDNIAVDEVVAAVNTILQRNFS